MKILTAVLDTDVECQSVVTNIPSTFLLNNTSIQYTLDPDSGAKRNFLSYFITQQDSADSESAYAAFVVYVQVTFQDWKPILQLTPSRVDDAQAGYKVVGFAPLSVVQKEFDNYEYFVPSNGSPGYVLYRGILKVSKTDVFTPQFLSYSNTQFQF
jgi:hypothetical protein